VHDEQHDHAVVELVGVHPPHPSSGGFDAIRKMPKMTSDYRADDFELSE